jgi:hypothetical protein
VEAGVFALVIAFQGVAALPVVVAQFVVNGAIILSLFQALLGGRSLPVPEMEALMMVLVIAEARLRRRRGKNYGRMVFETKSRQPDAKTTEYGFKNQMTNDEIGGQDEELRGPARRGKGHPGPPS